MSEDPAKTRSREVDCDFLVIGSGAAGPSAAVTAAWHGLKVVVVEKDPVCGGATEWSGGWMWVPRNPLSQAAGIVEDPELPRAYLRHELGNNYDAARVEAFLDAAPKMVVFSSMAIHLARAPDDDRWRPSRSTAGASVQLCSGKLVGRSTRRRAVRHGHHGGPDLYNFIRAMRSMAAFVYASRRIARHVLDLVGSVAACSSSTAPH